jgi:hypothetical protein
MFEPARRTVLRTVILYVCIFGIASLALGSGAYLYARQELAKQLDASMAERMDRLTKIFAVRGQAGLAAAINSYTSHGVRTFGYVLTDARGRSLYSVEGVPRLAPGWGLIGFDDLDEGRIDPARTLTRRLADGSTLTIVADRFSVRCPRTAVPCGDRRSALARTQGTRTDRKSERDRAPHL